MNVHEIAKIMLTLAESLFYATEVMSHSIATWSNWRKEISITMKKSFLLSNKPSIRLTLLFWFIVFHCSSTAAHARDEPSLVASNQTLTLQKLLNPKALHLRSSTALIIDQQNGDLLYAKDDKKPMSIASITKLMTAMVTLDAKLPMQAHIRIKRADRDRLRGSKSKLSYGTLLTRHDVLLISLAASENRAAAALARTFPGGKKAFINAMNNKAKQLGMKNSTFQDSTGLHSGNQSTAQDLAKLVTAAYTYPLIRDMTTTGRNSVMDLRSGWKVEFFNTNRLVRNKHWHIDLSKTGYIADSGHCLVMQTTIENRSLIVILLNSWGKLSKFGDANRIRKWLTRAEHKLLRQKKQLSLRSS